MSIYTRCPHCDTHFRVTREQLQASSGQVRCGRCQRIFDAFATLTSQLPATATGKGATPAASPPSSDPVRARESPPSSPPVAPRTASFRREQTEPSHRTAASTAFEAPASIRPQAPASAEVEEPEILTLPDDLFGPGAARPDSGRRWPWALACLVLALALLSQGLYFFATELAVRLPQFRPQLTEACRLLRCAVALPRIPDQLFIEASDLQVLDAARPGEVLLTATIRNRAAVTQELPLLELTLTDVLNQTTARKVFYPADYLDKSQDQEQGIGSNQEVPVKLYLDTANIKPAGYRLYLFFA
jgi:predicted Zn finger-like uncharacterized protein